MKRDRTIERMGWQRGFRRYLSSGSIRFTGRTFALCVPVCTLRLCVIRVFLPRSGAED